MKDFFKNLLESFGWIVILTFGVATMFALAAELGAWIWWAVLGIAVVESAILTLLYFKFDIDVGYEVGQFWHGLRIIANKPRFKNVFGFAPIRPDSEMRFPQEAVVEHILTQLA